LGEAITRNVRNFGVDANGEAASGLNHEGESTDATPRDGAPCSSNEVRESGWSEGGACSEAKSVGPTSNGRSPKDEAKPFCISRWEVWEAYLKVKSNKGAAGLDAQTIRGWKLHRCTAQSIQDLARMINPKLRGWINYYGRFMPSALRPIERHVGQSLVRWACRKYKKLRNHRTRAWQWLLRVIDRQPNLLALWEQRSEVFTIGAV